MAYIDDNNDLAAGKGKDPIKELDEELEKLMAELKELDDSESQTDTPEPPPVQEEHFDIEQPVRKVQRDSEPPLPPKKKSKAPIIIAVVVLAAVLIGVGIWKLSSMPLFSRGDKADTDSTTPADTDSTTPTELFYDPELGTVSVKQVDEEALNQYDANNLVKNDNGYYEYIVDGKSISTVGVDVSAHQGDIDFEAVKNSGVDFVILRIGGRFYSDEGALYEDENFDTYYENAKAAGLKVGAYFFSQAASIDDAVEEANFCVKKLNGRTLDYPVAFDWETIEDDDARTDNMDGKTITAMAEAFCDAIEDNGYDAIVYASTSLMLQSYDFDTMKDYRFWLADYREFPNMYYDFDMWQYSKEGTVDGIDGTVDLILCFKPY